MSKPRIWVSTLYCGEKDYEQCLKSIHNQKNVEIEHHIIKNLSELEAHQRQIETWLAVRDKFDLFVKVDADTVIINDYAISSVCEVIKKENASAAQIYLLDYFTCTLINGLNFYTPETEFTIPTDKIYCDRSVKHRKIIYSDSFQNDLIPIGDHCFHSSFKQAFHFGLHRGIKKQFHLIDKIKKVVLADNSSRRLFALKGFEVSQSISDKFDYNDQQFEELFEKAYKEINPKL